MTALPYFTDITTPNEYLTPFPDMDTVFVAHQAWLKDHFLPLISIDLGMLNKEWQGQVVHMLNPFEPFEGYIGECTHEYHNEFIGENYIAFKLTDDNHYEFLGKEGYFERANGDNHHDDVAEQIANYEKQKLFFKEYGFMADVNYPQYDGKYNKKNLLDDLGGGFWYGNWTSCPDIPSAFSMTVQDDVEDGTPNEGIEISYQGNPFYYIGNVAGYNYGGFGADAIILMYEPISKIVLFTYDWS